MKKEIPVGKTNLGKLLDAHSTRCSAVMLQAALANNDDISFGYNGNLDFFLQPGRSSVVPVNDARNIWVSAPNPNNILSFDIIME
jgi:hypothetical protein